MFGWLKKKKMDTSIDYVEFEEIPSGDMQFDNDDPLSLSKMDEFGTDIVNRIDNSYQMIASITTSVTDMVKYTQKIKYDIAKLDHELDKFIVSSNTSLEKFKSAMPVLESQLTRISNRIDMITNVMLQNVMNAKDPESIQKHEKMMEMLTEANNSFNNMLVKLIGL